ncbi:MAG: hypothetical protein R3B52_02815 [Candidatus Paceibacterota bacterium]
MKRELNRWLLVVAIVVAFAAVAVMVKGELGEFSILSSQEDE